MPKQIIVCLFSIYLFPLNGATQRIDHTSSFQSIASDRYFRVYYDNDFFTKTDYYYTQGVCFEYVNPAIGNVWPHLKRPATSRLNASNSIHQYGITLNQFCFTPINKSSDNIVFGDRPFSGEMTAELFSIATDSLRHKRIDVTISVGIIGPAALGKEIQTGIHRITGDALPKGWQNQISNDVVLNVRVNMEKQLLAAPRYFLLNIVGGARAGTLNDNLSAGLNFMAGIFTNAYERNANKKNKWFQWDIYSQSMCSLVGYDATLQGGMFDRKNPYTIRTGDIRRFTFQQDAGIRLDFGRVSLSYYQSYLTKEFSTGLDHRWGGVNMGVAL